MHGSVRLTMSFYKHNTVTLEREKKKITPLHILTLSCVVLVVVTQQYINKLHKPSKVCNRPSSHLDTLVLWFVVSIDLHCLIWGFSACPSGCLDTTLSAKSV